MNFAGPFDSELTHDTPVSLGGERFAFDSKPGFVQHHVSDSHVVVPDAHLLFSGDYTRIGSDLIISGNGQKFVVGNYFKGETRPTLTSKDGATLAGHIVDALTGHVHYAQATAAPAAGEVIGHVQKLSGSASVIRNGVSIELQIGAAVQKGDVIQTGSNSSLGMTFVDGSAFGMTSNARMVLNEMIFDPNGSSNSSLISLVQGTITFVAGQTAKNGNMRVETPVATMGIRGTAVLVEIGANDGPTKFSVLVEPDGTTGAFNLYDKVTGQLIGTVSQAGQVTFVSSLGIGQPPTAIEQLKTLADQQAEKAIIQQVFQLYFPNYKPDDSNPKQPKFGFNSSGNNLAEIIFNTTTNQQKTFLTQIELRFAVTDPLTGITTYQNKIFYNSKAQFSALAVSADQAFVSTTETFKFMDVVKIDDPDIGNAPFYDIGVPFVAGSAVITSAVSTIGHLTEAFLKPLLHINQTTGVVSFDREQFNFLDDGETVIFMIRVTATSGPDTGTVLIPVTITGANDAPTIVVGAATTTTGDVKEDTAVTTSGDVATSGTITFQDVDLTDAHTATVSLTSTASSLPGFVAGTEIGQFTIDPVSESSTDTNNHGSVGWHFKLADNNPTLQSLAKDQTITQTYTITIKDNNNVPVTQTVTITITGTNDAPVLTADASVHQANEVPDTTGAPNSVVDVASGTLTFTDVDLSDTHQASAVLHPSATSVVWSGGPYSGIPSATIAALGSAVTAVVTESNTDTSNQGSIAWEFKLPDHLFDFLADGETLTLIYNVTVTDNNGVSSTQQITVQVGAANDQPVITVLDNGAVQEDVGVATGNLLTDTGSVTFTDTDLSDTHTAHVVYNNDATGAVVSTALATALATALTVPASALSAGTHSFSWNFALDNSLVQYLAKNETITLSYTITVGDNSGETNDTSTGQVVTVTITGTNDAPTITSGAAAATATVAELTDTTGSTALDQAGGTVTFGDVDLTDTHQVTQSNATFAWSGGPLTPSQISALTDASARTLVLHDSTGTGSGSIDWTYKITDSALDFLADGQTLTVTYDITVADYHNGVATGTSTGQTVTVTYAGSNDAPVVSAVVSDALVVEDGPVSVLNALANALDADNGATLSVVNVPGTLPAGVTYDAINHTFTLDPTDPAYQHLADGATTTVTVNYGVSDGIVTTPTPASVSWTITGMNDAPVVSAAVSDALVVEDGPTSILNALANTSDVDDGAALSVVNVPGTLPAGVTYDALSHSFTLNPTDPAYQHLADGATTTVTVNYGVSDGIVATPTPASVSWTITGTNDAPLIDTSNVQISTSGGNTIISGAAIVDPDAGEAFSVSLLPNSGSVAGTLDAITYTPPGSPPQIGKVMAALSDIAGADDTVNFIFNVSGTDPLTMQGTSEKDVFFATAYQDTFVFAPGSNQDIITNGFQSGTDRIDLQAFTSIDATALTGILADATHPEASDTLLNLNGTTDTLLLKGVTALNASDFILYA